MQSDHILRVAREPLSWPLTVPLHRLQGCNKNSESSLNTHATHGDGSQTRVRTHTYIHENHSFWHGRHSVFMPLLFLLVTGWGSPVVSLLFPPFLSFFSDVTTQFV